MKTLIIHPRDNSTTFLSEIYSNIPDKTIITHGVTKKRVRELIKEHDRVIMLGHGSPGGLLSIRQFGTTNGFIIDYSMVDVLKEKKDNVFIWCNADQFVFDYELEGFYSGMFISEIVEANYCGIFEVDENEIITSNRKFCDIVSENINENSTIIYENVKKEYGEFAKENRIAHYNFKRLYLK